MGYQRQEESPESKGMDIFWNLTISIYIEKEKEILVLSFNSSTYTCIIASPMLTMKSQAETQPTQHTASSKLNFALCLPISPCAYIAHVNCLVPIQQIKDSDHWKRAASDDLAF